jgi:hypothetical protein
MTTTTQLANYALAHLGEAKISDIDDTNSKPARVCKEFIQPTIDEVLRTHRWNCATKRATLSASSTPPTHGYTTAYVLPSDFLRLLEINGEPWNGSEEFFELEANRRILIDSDECQIRYIARIPVNEFDPLLTKAVAATLAMTIVVPLTGNLQLQGQLSILLQRALSAARQVDAIEVGAREGRGLRRILDNSPLIQSRFTSAYNIRRLLNRFPRW